MISALRLCMLAALITTGCTVAMAQRMIRVSGTVYNVSGSNKRLPLTEAEVIVFSCKTVAQGEKMKNDLDADVVELTSLIDPESVTQVDRNGYYEILVPDNGALVFKAEMSKAVLMEVNSRMKIDVSIDLGLQLAEVVVTGLRTELQPEPSVANILGNRFIVENTFTLPHKTGNSFSRLVIQPYTIMCSGTDFDTIAYNRPIVIDGELFRKTQVRKTGFDLSRDPLEMYVDRNLSLTDEQMVIEWRDTVKVPDPNVNYSCYADFIIENAHTLVFNRNFQIVSCKNKRPLRFLEYSLAYKDMDFNSVYYREKAQIEKRNSADRVSLNFVISSDKLVDTPENMENMNKIRRKLKEIMDEPGATLKELYITGYSSPEGVYKSNLALAEKRTDRILNDVVSVLPKTVNNMLYKLPKAEVRPWSDVVELMRKDSLANEAEDIEKIIEKYPDNMNRQSAAVARLPYYRKTVVGYLEKLRTVEYRIKYEVYREPTDEEVWQDYENKGTEGMYTRYEYWKLFQMIKNDRDLEKLAIKAYRESVEQNADRPWALAANVAAVQYLKRDTFDVKLLEPLIDKTVYITNYERVNANTRRKELVNPVEIVNNQLCMYIKANDFREASVMAKLLPEEEQYDLIKAYAWALGGYYKGGNTQEEAHRSRKTFDMIKASSERNAVVMYLALDTKAGNAIAEKLLKKLPQDDAMTWYFKAVISARKGDAGFADTMMNLYQCFTADKDYIIVAENDGEFTEEVVEEAKNMLMFNEADTE